jgi:hypothetical protein
LQVGVHHHHGLPAGVVQAGGDGHLVPEVAGQGQHAVARLAGGQLAEEGGRFVARAVVDEHHLPGLPHRGDSGQQRAQPPVQLRDHRLLVEDGDDQGQRRRHWRGYTKAAAP